MIQNLSTAIDYLENTKGNKILDTPVILLTVYRTISGDRATPQFHSYVKLLNAGAYENAVLSLIPADLDISMGNYIYPGKSAWANVMNIADNSVPCRYGIYQHQRISLALMGAYLKYLEKQ